MDEIEAWLSKKCPNECGELVRVANGKILAICPLCGYVLQARNREEAHRWRVQLEKRAVLEGNCSVKEDKP